MRIENFRIFMILKKSWVYEKRKFQNIYDFKKSRGCMKKENFRIFIILKKSWVYENRKFQNIYDFKKVVGV